MAKKKSLTQSLEDYLETILLLESKNRVARVKDIASHLKVQMPSVTGALKTLKSRELVEYEKNSYITLTPKGKMQARQILKKHNIIENFLTEVLLIDPEKAAEQACLMEHTIDLDTATRLERCGTYLKENSPDSDLWKKTLSSPGE